MVEPCAVWAELMGDKTAAFFIYGIIRTVYILYSNRVLYLFYILLSIIRYCTVSNYLVRSAFTPRQVEQAPYPAVPWHASPSVL